MSRTSPDPALDRFQSLASRAGHAWADACTRELISQRRAIVGAWPGTLSEARGRVLVALSEHDHSTLSLDDLRDLARTANRAARDVWRALAVPDVET